MDLERLIKTWLKAIMWVAVAVALFYIESAFAADGDKGFGGIAKNVTSTFGNLAKLITAGSYVAGLAFAVGAILKFKAHKDNPTQIPIGTPLALLFIAAALIFLPAIFQASGETLFGSTAGKYAGISGIEDLS